MKIEIQIYDDVGIYKEIIPPLFFFYRVITNSNYPGDIHTSTTLINEYIPYLIKKVISNESHEDRN